SYLKEYGFLYSMKRDFSDSTKIVSTNLSEEIHEEEFNGRWFSYETLTEDFEPGKRYYFTAFASTADTTTYGTIESFRTVGPPDVIILYPEYRETTSMRRIIVDIKSDDEDGLELTMYWGTDRNNLTEQTYIYYESDWGNYYANIYDLQPETKYWLVAEATDSYGTSRSDTVAFYTYGSFIDDRDDTEYKSIIIGNQKWMAENLRYAGNIPLGQPTSNTQPYRYYPNGEEDNVETYGYGYLYNWAAAMNTATDSSSVMNPSGVQGICPNGWHLPSEAEWQELHNELGTGIFDDAGSQMAGGYWESGKLNQSYYFSTSGFNALPAGGYYGNMRNFGEDASFWSTTETIWEETSENLVSNYGIEYSSTSLHDYWAVKSVGISVRCIKGTTIYAALDTITICGDEYTYLDTTVTESGDYMRRFYFAEDADTAYCLHLTLNHPPRVELEQTACEVFEWNGEIYTELGDYVQTLVDVNGCDSIVTVHLIDLDDCYGTVSGIITDAGTGTAIVNARVTIGTETTRTNTEGEYSLSVPRGNWLMKVLASGYALHSETIDIQTDTTLNIELIMPQITTNVDDISATTYPYLAHNDSVTISNTSQIPLIWSSVTDYENIELLPEEEEIHRSRNSRALWDSIQTFTTQFNAEQAIATDGFFIYTS
ncbi:MAG: carboxypeptidase regulatory-like domain-containing protein, partial [Bacteroidales bacterium]|nr:carboxypeptidase regulatory-like domain-containing protein [Bacteroidales bacterium]